MNRAERPTAPPSDAELEALASFELMIRERGESDARLAQLRAVVDGEALALAEDE